MRVTRTQDLLIGAVGFGTTVLTAMALAWCELHWGEPLYAHMEYLVLPIGAVGAGAIAATGHYVGGRLLRLRPTLLLAVVVALTSVLAFFLIHYFEYRWSAPSKAASFRSYLDRAFRTSRLVADVPWQRNELDDAGYLVAGLQILGFAAGGLFVFLDLRRVPSCGACRHLMVRETRDTTFEADGREFGRTEDSVRDRLDEGDVRGAVELHRLGRSKASPRDDYSSVLEVRRCPRCRKPWVAFTTRRRGAGNVTWSAYIDEAAGRLSGTSGPRRSFDRARR